MSDWIGDRTRMTLDQYYQAERDCFLATSTKPNTLQEQIMGNKEIERKFLIKNNDWEQYSKGCYDIVQGYITAKPAVRIRLEGGGSRGLSEQAKLTIKSANAGMTRSEFEYDIPVQDATAMFKEIPMKKITKQRHVVECENMLWEIDVFADDNIGLIIAEVELTHEAETFVLPDWVGKEVTECPHYYNSYLASLPYTEWDMDDTQMPQM